jgi:hypothetical protein
MQEEVEAKRQPLFDITNDSPKEHQQSTMPLQLSLVVLARRPLFLESPFSDARFRSYYRKRTERMGVVFVWLIGYVKISNLFLFFKLGVAHLVG